MSVKSFSSLLIGLGVFVAFSMFAFCNWRPDFDFISNIRYAVLFEWEGETSYAKESISLAQGLILPVIIIGLGLSVRVGIVESKHVIRFLPFLTE